MKMRARCKSPGPLNRNGSQQAPVDLRHQLGNHLKLTLCSVWTSRHAKRTEQAIHHALGRRYIRGEWFDVSPDDAEAACLAAGATRTTQAEAIIDYTRKPTKASTRLDWLLGPNFIS